MVSKKSENNLDELVHCIYSSAARTEFSLDDLAQLLDESRKNNSVTGLTGILLYHERSFFQVLEGPRNVVEELYGKICKDIRHENILKLIIEPIEERSFNDWTMGYAQITRDDVKKIPGLNGCIIKRGFFGNLPIGRARELLNAFKSGKWRRTIK